ncbi:MAG TPA: hypothetical protein VM780_08290 [Hansschlegelia sp.]|nr:hypothetical protein [Hansschlegelia sp.]
MSYRIVATAGQKAAIVSVSSVLDALRVARTHVSDRGLKVTIVAGDGWTLSLEELEELARP